MSIKTLFLSLLCQTLSFTIQAKIQYGSLVKNEDKKILQADLDFLKHFDLQSHPSNTLLRLFRIEQFTTDKLIEWLEARVGHIINDTKNQDLKLGILQTSYPYPNPERFPVHEKPGMTSPRLHKTDEKSVTLMSNIGTAIYLSGKRVKSLIGIKIADQTIAVTSPRVGILKISPGLFLPQYQVDPKDLDLPANRLNRLHVLIHEARHSDGHGFSLGFLHAVCPIGHTLAGALACDRNRNGPYTLGAMFLRELIQSCHSCRSSSKEQLRLRYLESFSRVIEAYYDSDLTQSELLEIQLLQMEIQNRETLLTVTKDPSNKLDLKEKIAKLKTRISELDLKDTKSVIVKTVNWDPAPEGRR